MQTPMHINMCCSEAFLTTSCFDTCVFVTQVDAVNSPPTIANVIAGVGPSSATATAYGSFATTSGANGTVVVTGLTPATNYTVSLTCPLLGAMVCKGLGY